MYQLMICGLIHLIQCPIVSGSTITDEEKANFAAKLADIDDEAGIVACQKRH